MAVGSDEEIFGTTKKGDQPKRKAGRPKIDRDLALRLFQAKYDNATVAAHLGIKRDTAGRIRRQLIKDGKLGKEKTQKDLVQADFDEECIRARGFSFLGWLKNKRKPDNAQYLFNFCEKVWRITWGRPSLFLASDRSEQLGDQLAQQFLSEFKEDSKRIRQRKKHIRQLFTFLGREDINGAHLTMSNERDPRAKRDVPEISMPDFPPALDAALDEMEARYDLRARTWLEVKICTGIRTGDRKEHRGLLGLSADSQTPSYIFFRGGTWRAQAFEKKGETWALTWIPKKVIDHLKILYDAAMKREEKYIFNWTGKEKADISKAWRVIAKKHTGADLTFHDLRKVAITWLYSMNIPLEIATSMNVGWKDLSTARDHYLNLRAFLKKSARLEYQAAIPDWYKDGLEEYSREE